MVFSVEHGLLRSRGLNLGTTEAVSDHTNLRRTPSHHAFKFKRKRSLAGRPGQVILA